MITPCGLIPSFYPADKCHVRALSIRQPYAELILRGIKTAELRSRMTHIVGERFYIYASKGVATKRQVTAQRLVDDEATKGIWSSDLSGLTEPPEWMIELAEQVKMIEPGALLPTGVIVGSAVIERVSLADEMYRWHLADVRRAKTLRKPTGHPQPGWFRPF